MYINLFCQVCHVVLPRNVEDFDLEKENEFIKSHKIFPNCHVILDFLLWARAVL